MFFTSISCSTCYLNIEWKFNTFLWTIFFIKLKITSRFVYKSIKNQRSSALSFAFSLSIFKGRFDVSLQLKMIITYILVWLKWKAAFCFFFRIKHREFFTIEHSFDGGEQHVIEDQILKLFPPQRKDSVCYYIIGVQMLGTVIF